MVQRFYDFMNSGQLYWLAIASLAFQPVSILVHELGHALVILALTDKDVTIDVGHKREREPQARIGRLAFRTSFLRSQMDVLRLPVAAVPTDPAGTASYELIGVAPGRQVAITLGGPAASLVLAVACAFLANGLSGTAASIAWVMTVYAAGMVVLNLIPRRDSDGAMVIRKLRARRLVAGGATAISAEAGRVVFDAFSTWAAQVVAAPRFAQELDQWVATLWLNERRAAGAPVPAGVSVAFMLGVFARWREGPGTVPPSLASAVAGGAVDPLAAAAVARLGEQLAAGGRSPESDAMRYVVVLRARSRSLAFDALRWFEMGRALVDVFAARSARTPEPVA